MISTTAKYALRAAVYLATQGTGFSSRSSIAQATVIPHDYLLKVLNRLDVEGIVRSQRGPGGGYRLVSGPDEVTALQVVLAVDDTRRIKECPLGFSDHVKLCPLHQLLDEASEMVESHFQSATLFDLVPKGSGLRCGFPTKKST